MNALSQHDGAAPVAAAIAAREVVDLFENLAYVGAFELKSRKWNDRGNTAHAMIGCTATNAQGQACTAPLIGGTLLFRK